MQRYNLKQIDLTPFARAQIQPRWQKVVKHRCAYSICCRPKVAGGIVLSCDVKAVEGYVMVNFEVASSSIFRDNHDILVPEVGSGADGINAICSRPEVANDLISGYNVQTCWDYHAPNL